jgi:hypothetical protein
MAITISGSGITSANIADGTITTDDILASDVSSLKSGRKNLIINGDMQVSQRGDFTTATVTTTNDYNIDRWQSDSNVVTETVQDTSRKIKYTATSTATGLLGGGQGIELTDSFLDAKTVTISAKVTSNNPNARISFLYLGGANAWVGGTAHTGGGTEETLTLTVTLPSALTRVKVDVRICDTDGVSNVAITNGDYIEFGEVQLEVGSVATDFEHRSYGEELALCQRYFEIIKPNVMYSPISLGFARTTTNARCDVSYTEKRGVPTISYSNATHFGIYNGSNRSVSAVSTGVPNSRVCQFDCTTTSLTTRECLRLMILNTDASISIDAEL